MKRRRSNMLLFSVGVMMMVVVYTCHTIMFVCGPE